MGSVLMIALTLFVQRTQTGKAMRATSFDREAAAMMGIDVDRVIVVTFFKAVVVVGSFYLYISRRHGAVRLGAFYYFLVVFCPWVYGLGVLARK